MKTFTVEGEDYIEKQVSKQSDTTGKIYLPGAWIGRRVAVILILENNTERAIPCPNCWTPEEGNMAILKKNGKWECTHCDGAGAVSKSNLK